MESIILDFDLHPLRIMQRARSPKPVLMEASSKEREHPTQRCAPQAEEDVRVWVIIAEDAVGAVEARCIGPSKLATAVVVHK
jgi:hypothetical protein